MSKIAEQITYSSREKAWLTLLTSEVKTGHLYLRRYQNEEGKLDILMAYGVKDCEGYPESIDSLKVISGSSPIPVYNVVFYEPDVSELAKGQIFLWVNMRDETKMDCTVYYVTIEQDEDGIYQKTYTDFGEKERKVYSLTQGEFYFVSGTSFRPEADFYTREEINGTITERLDNDIIPSVIELQRTVFPLSLSFSVSPTIAELGTTADITLSYSVKRKGVNVTDKCNISLTDLKDNPIEIPGDNILRGRTSSNSSFKLTAEYEPGYFTSSSISVSFVNRSYWGVISRTVLPTMDTLRSLNNGLRTKGQFTYSGINLDLTKTVVYAYPSAFGNLSSIKDANGFEYIQDYTKNTILFNGVSYNVYTKITPTVITGFKQIYSF